MNAPIEQIQLALPDRYQLEQQLTEKPDRQTWLAQDLQENRSVVLKILWFSGPSIWQNLKYFEREAQFLKQISHPAIPNFLDYFDLQVAEQHSFVLVQDYIPARSLNQHREDGRTFSEADIKEIIQQVLDILRYLHQQDPPILHRDIKPSNLLLSDRSAHSIGQVYLVDFGAAKSVTESVGKTLTVVGSYGYAPIEQFGGRAVPASDIYSLGATIIYLLTGRHPAELPQVDLSIQFTATTNISLGLKNWITHATQPFVDRRFSNAETALEELMNPIEANLSNSESQKINRPFGSQITCDRFDTFLQIKQPIIDPNLARAIVVKEFMVCLVVWSTVLIVTLFFTILLGFLIGIMLAVLWSSDLALMICFWGCLLIWGSVSGVILKRWHKRRPNLLPWLIRQDCQISDTRIRRERWFLFKWKPEVDYLTRSKISQIDRILAHKEGHHNLGEQGLSVQWADVASKIELRSESVTFTLENLKEPEVDWLCAELSDYLDIPVITHTIGSK